MNKYHMNQSHIKSVVLKVNNLEQSVAFYKDVMSLDILKEEKEKVHLGQNQAIILTLIKSNDTYQVQEGLYHIAFLLKDEIQLASWLKKNINYKKFVGASHHGVSQAIYLEDPDGHGIEVYADTDDQTWQYKNQQIDMVTEPLDLNALLLKARDDVKLDVIIGHIHLQARSVEKVRSFYKILGFEEMLNMQSASFLSFNNYHHHLAVNQWHGNRLKAHDVNRPGIDSFEIIYTSKLLYEQVINNIKTHQLKSHLDGASIVVEDPLNIKIKLTYKGEQ